MSEERPSVVKVNATYTLSVPKQHPQIQRTTLRSSGTGNSIARRNRPVGGRNISLRVSESTLDVEVSLGYWRCCQWCTFGILYASVEFGTESSTHPKLSYE